MSIQKDGARKETAFSDMLWHLGHCMLMKKPTIDVKFPIMTRYISLRDRLRVHVIAKLLGQVSGQLDVEYTHTCDLKDAIAVNHLK